MSNKVETQIDKLNKMGIHVHVQHLRYVCRKIEHNSMMIVKSGDIKYNINNSTDKCYLLVSPLMELNVCKRLIEDSPIKLELSPWGGSVMVTLLDTEKNVISFGQSVCAFEDAYKRKLGFNIALKRAMKNADIKIDKK